MSKSRTTGIRFHNISRSMIILGSAVIVIVPLDISGWLTALLRYAL